jgi:hypothetical protein
VLDGCGSHITTLSLDDDHVKADSLAKLFKRSPFLIHISLSNMLIDTLDCAWEHISKSLIWLDLGHINTLSASASLRSLLMATPNLHHLAFTHNALNTKDQTETLLALSTLARLEELEVGNIRNRGKFTMSDALLHLPCLKTIKFTGFPGADAKLALCLRSAPNLQCFSLRNFSDFGFMEEWGAALQMDGKLQHLDISGCLLEETQVLALAAGLEHQYSLRSLNLANCKASGEVILRVVHALAKGLVSELDLAGNRLEFKEGLDLPGALEELNLLEKVRLNGIKWEGVDVQRLGKALAGVTSLSLDSTEPQVRLLELLPRLSTLSMCNCSLTDTSLASLSHTLRDLHTLGLDFNKLSSASLPLLVDLCLAGKTCISLRGNLIGEVDLETVSAELDAAATWLLEENLVLR